MGSPCVPRESLWRDGWLAGIPLHPPLPKGSLQSCPAARKELVPGSTRELRKLGTRDEDKTKEQLVNELLEMRMRIADLEGLQPGKPPTVDAAGSHIGAFHILSEITKREQGENALGESEIKFRYLFSRFSLHLPILLVRQKSGRSRHQCSQETPACRRAEPALQVKPLFGIDAGATRKCT